MFYSSEILNIKSNANLGVVWLAATLGPKSNARKLGRKDLTSISVSDTCAYLSAPPEPLSLRLSANLMIGVSRVYGQQCQFHFSDVQGLCTKLSHVNTPANPEAIDLPNHEKKGTNITLKKIDCISAVNVLPGDNLNFPDLDITNLLLDHNNNNNNNRSSLSSSNPSAEIGRKSMLLGTPFSTVSSSSNALQGSDFTAAISDSDYGSLNDHDMPYGSDDFQLAVRPSFNTERNSETMEFKVPDELTKQKRRFKRLKNNLMDHDLMLEKDQLFINDQEMMKFKDNLNLNELSDPITEALKLLNNPDDYFIPGTFDSIFKCKTFEFNIKKPKISNNNNDQLHPKTTNSTNISVNEDLMYDDGGFYDDIEMFRNEPSNSSSINSTPSTLVLPWSASSSSDKQGRILSSILNTPIRKGGQSTPSPLTDTLQELKLSSSSSSTSFASSSATEIFQNQVGSTLSQESFDFFYFLVDSMPTKSGSTELSRVLKRESTSRPIAARALHHLLELRSANLITVNQSHPFSDIKISIN